MGVREGLLGLLAVGPSHGYQLKLDLEAATGHGFALNVGQVYTTLQRLERDGLVAIAETDADGRVVHEITDAGREAVAAWWVEPVDSAAAGRDEVAIKLLLAIATGSVEPRAVIDAQRRAVMGLLQDYTRIRADGTPGDDRDELAWQLRLDRLVYNAEAELRWLDRVEERLQAMALRPRPASGVGDAASGRATVSTTSGGDR